MNSDRTSTEGGVVLGFRVARIGILCLAVFCLLGFTPTAVATHYNGSCYYNAEDVIYDSGSGSARDPVLGTYWANWAVCYSANMITCVIYVDDGTTIEIFQDRYALIFEVMYKGRVRADKASTSWSCTADAVYVPLTIGSVAGVGGVQQVFYSV